MNHSQSKIDLATLSQVIDRLEEVLAEPLNKNNYVLDACIQRFEFVVELYWRTFKHLLKAEGIDVQTPKQCLQGAYQAKWIDEEALWINMLNDRNLTFHTYKEAYARKIYDNIQIYFPEMRKVLTQLKNHLHLS